MIAQHLLDDGQQIDYVLAEIVTAKEGDPHPIDAMRPVPAPAVEEIVRDRLSCIIGMSKQSSHVESKTAPKELNESSLRERIRELILRVVIGDSRVTITFNGKAVAALIGISSRQVLTSLRARLPSGDNVETVDENIVLTVPVRLRMRGGVKRVEGWDKADWSVAKPRHDHALIKALSRAHEWREWIERGEIANIEGLAKRADKERRHAHALLKLAFLAADIQRDILTARQPTSLTLTSLIEADLPLAWANQRTLLRNLTATFYQSGG